MKYQQTLILGGIYLLLMLAAGYIHNFIGALIAWASLGLFAFFLVCLSFNHPITFLQNLLSGHPVVSRFLIIIGWIPFVTLLAEFVAVLTAFLSGKENRLNEFYIYLSWFTVVSFVLSLLYESFHFLNLKYKITSKSPFKIVREILEAFLGL